MQTRNARQLPNAQKLLSDTLDALQSHFFTQIKKRRCSIIKHSPNYQLMDRFTCPACNSGISVNYNLYDYVLEMSRLDFLNLVYARVDDDPDVAEFFTGINLLDTTIDENHLLLMKKAVTECIEATTDDGELTTLRESKDIIDEILLK